MKSITFVSLLFAQMDVKESTDQKERDTQPRQDETIAKAPFAQISRFT